MRLVSLIAMIFLISSCSTKYSGSHSNYQKFTQDIEYLKKACKNKTKIFYIICQYHLPLPMAVVVVAAEAAEAAGSVAFDKIKFIKLLTFV